MKALPGYEPLHIVRVIKSIGSIVLQHPRAETDSERERRRPPPKLGRIDCFWKLFLNMKYFHVGFSLISTLIPYVNQTTAGKARSVKTALKISQTAKDFECIGLKVKTTIHIAMPFTREHGKVRA